MSIIRSTGLPQVTELPTDAPTDNGPRFVQFEDSNTFGYWDGADWNTAVLGREELDVTVSASATVSLSTDITVFTGTTSTFTLPTGAAGYLGRLFKIKNRGSGGVTLDVLGGSTTIYETSAVTSIVIPAGESRDVTWDGTYWIIL